MQFALLWGILLVRLCTGASQVPEQHEESVRDVLARLKQVQDSRDFAALENLFGDVFSKKRKPNDHFELVKEFCAVLNSVNFKNNRQAEILQRLAVKTVVDFDNQLPVSLRVQLVRHIQLDHEYRREKLRGAEWATVRRDHLVLWLKAFEQLDKGIDRRFDFEDRPYKNLAPPGNNYPSGVSPESIKEPEIREQYVKLLKANAEKNERYMIQGELRSLEKAYLRELELNVVRAYSFEPISVEEIREKFDAFAVPKELTARVIKQLEARLLAKIDRDAKLAKALEASKAKAPESVPFRENPLSTDRRLRVSITVNMTKPKVEEILTLLSSKTGLPITVSSNIPKDRLAFWSVSFHNVPAYVVMEELNKAVVDKGHWLKQENGYQLFGELKPTLESLREGLVKDREAPPGRSGFAVVLIIVSIGVLACLAVVAIFYRRKRNTKI